MTQTQQKAVINNEIFFDALFSSLVLKDIEAISPDRRGTNRAFAFDEACLESFRQFEETCNEYSIEIKASLMLSPIHGTCDSARSYLLWMAQNGHGHFRMPYNGVFYFDILQDSAQRTITEIAEEYTILEDVLLVLADTFLDIYTK